VDGAFLIVFTLAVLALLNLPLYLVFEVWLPRAGLDPRRPPR